MAFGVDVGIHAQGDGCLSRLRGGELSDAVELTGRLRIDRANLGSDGVLQLVSRLSDAGEDDVARRKSCAPGYLDFASRIGIDPAPNGSEQPHDGQRGVGFECVMNSM